MANLLADLGAIPVSLKEEDKNPLSDLGAKPVTETQLNRNISPLSATQRAAVDIASPAGGKQFLEREFGPENVKVTGQKVFGLPETHPDQELRFDVMGRPADPQTGFDPFSKEGLIEAGKDIADVAGEGIRLMFQGIGEVAGGAGGAIVGTPAGAPGTVTGLVKGRALGGGIGRAAGETVVKSVGNAFGLNPEETGTDQIGDIIQEGLAGAIGSNVAPPLSKAIGFVGKTANELVSNIYRSTIQPFTRQLFNFTASVPIEFIKDMQKRGAFLVTKSKFKDWENFIKPVLKNMQEAGKNLRQHVGNQYETIIKPDLKKKVDGRLFKANIDAGIVKIKKALNQIEDKNDKHVLNAAIRMIRENLPKLGVTEIPRKEVENAIPGVVTRAISPAKTRVANKIELKRVWEFRKALDEQFELFKRTGIEGVRSKAVIEDFRQTFVDGFLKGNSHLFKTADKKFSKAMKLVREWPTGKTRLKTFNSFMNRFPNLNAAEQGIIVEMNKGLPKNKQFLKDALAFASAASWYKNTWRVFRPTTLAAPIGLGAGLTGGFESDDGGFGTGVKKGVMASALTFIGGVAMSNPRILAQLLKVPDGARILSQTLVTKGAIPAAQVGGRLAVQNREFQRELRKKLKEKTQ